MNLLFVIAAFLRLTIVGGFSLAVDFFSSFEALRASLSMTSPSLPSRPHKVLTDAITDVIQSGAIQSIEQERYKEGALALKRIVDIREEDNGIALAGIALCLYSLDEVDLGRDALFDSKGAVTNYYNAVTVLMEEVAEGEAEAEAGIDTQTQIVLQTMLHALTECLAFLDYLDGMDKYFSQDMSGAIAALSAAVEKKRDLNQAYEWLARAYDRNREPLKFLEAWRTALDVNPRPDDRNVWPVYCLAGDSGHTGPSPLSLMKDEEAFIRNHPDVEVYAVTNSSRQVLSDFIHSLRGIECSESFVVTRNKAMHDYYDSTKEPGDDSPMSAYTYINFAYGQVFLPEFFQLLLLKDSRLREALQRARVPQIPATGSHSDVSLEVSIMGSNIGTESFYFALLAGVKVKGYEILCDFVDISNQLALNLTINNTHFACQDALLADVSDSAVVLLDDQAWDVDLLDSMMRKLDQEMPTGSVLIDYTTADPHGPAIMNEKVWTCIACHTLQVSWAPSSGTSVAVYQKLPYAFLGKSYKHIPDYTLMIQRIWYTVLTLLDLDVDTLTIRNTNVVNRYFPILEGVEGIIALVKVITQHPEYLSYQQYSNRVLTLYQKVLFNWHCDRYFDLSANLLPEEKEYVLKFFEIYGVEHRNFHYLGQWDGNRMSSYTYSHRIYPDGRVDSSRFRFGTVSQDKVLEPFALRVFTAKGITTVEELLREYEMQFVGIGWDVHDSSFRVYLMFDELLSLPQYLLDLCQGITDNPGLLSLLLNYGLVSFSFDDSVYPAKLVESKVYVYPKTLQAAASFGVDLTRNDLPWSTVAIMYSSVRNMLPQFDIDTSRLCAMRHLLSPPGQGVIDDYLRAGLYLETMAFGNATSYTLYFPSGSG